MSDRSGGDMGDSNPSAQSAATVAIDPEPIVAAAKEVTKTPEEELRKLYEDFSFPPSTIDGGVWRESGVLLAAVSALLYLTSQVFGAAYLSFFGVKAYLEGWGLGHLGMLSIPVVFTTGIIAAFVHLILTVEKQRRSYMGAAVFVVVVGGARVLLKLDAIDTIRGDDFHPMFLSFVGWAAAYAWQRDSIPTIANLEQAAIRARNILDQLPSQLNDRGLSAKRLIERLESYSVRRVRELRIRLWVLAAYVTMLSVIPFMAWMAAAGAAQQSYEQYRSVDLGAPPRMPVYWVGDRVVYITSEPIKMAGVQVGARCEVHVQIARVEQARFVCPDEVIERVKWRSD